MSLSSPIDSLNPSHHVWYREWQQAGHGIDRLHQAPQHTDTLNTTHSSPTLRTSSKRCVVRSSSLSMAGTDRVEFRAWLASLSCPSLSTWFINYEQPRLPMTMLHSHLATNRTAAGSSNAFCAVWNVWNTEDTTRQVRVSSHPLVACCCERVASANA